MSHSISDQTGAGIDRKTDIGQSIRKILTTPIGSRVKRRPFGSLIPELIDDPANPAGAMRLIAATADAIDKWEPRFQLQNVAVAPDMSGKTVLTITGITIPDGEAASFDIEQVAI